MRSGLQGKKQKGKWLAAMLLSGMLMTGLAGCGAGGGNGSVQYSAAVEEAYDSSSMSMPGEGALADNSAPQVGEQGNRKLIKTVDMSVETKDFDGMLVGLTQQITGCGGYVENMNTYNGSIYSGSRSERSSHMTIRIPEDKLDSFLGAVTELSNVISRNDSVDDVTLTYVDLESHKEALLTEQARLLELLEKAETVEDIITIEQRLSDVRYQIESMESQLRTYDNKISYSTVYLDIQEVKELTPVAEETTWERISGGFMESLSSVGNGFKEFFIWLIIKSPILVIWAVIILAIIGIIVKCDKRRQKKREAAYKAARQAQQAESAQLAESAQVSEMQQKEAQQPSGARSEGPWQEVSPWQKGKDK